ncbi:MAG: 3-hydroxybutyrate dehydrogenase [Pseudomonadota bacterium]
MVKGKTTLITGSTSGIGLEMAEAFAEAGSNIILNGLGDQDEIEATRKALQEKTGVAVAFDGANMLKPDEIVKMIERAEADFGGVDVLINNAGIQYVAPIEEFPIEKWDAIIGINQSAAFHTVRAVVPGMRERKWGRIINTASAHALVASPFKSAYVSAKHAVAGLTKTVALEVAEHGITVNAIAPGYVWTPMVESQIPDTAKSRGITEEEVKRDVLLAAQPTKEFVTVEEIAALALFLCTDGARSITGVTIPVDGGWTAQ